MADTDTKEPQGAAPEPEEDIVVIETPDGQPPAAQQQADDEDDAGEDDARLSGSQDDHDEDIDDGSSPTRKRRVKRRELQRRARDHAQAEIQQLRQYSAGLEQRLASLEGSAVQSTEYGYHQTYEQAMQEVRTAQTIIERASEAGNVADAMAARDIRDAAMAKAQQAQDGYNQLQHYKQQQAQPQQPAAQIDPQTQRWANEWLQANPWYDPRGGDEDSAIATAIEASMKAQGYDSTTRAYWEELSRRVSARIGGGDEGGGERRQQPRSGPPPQGGGRNHAPQSTRREIYVTPERKAAMVEAGIWDDVPRRNRMLKQYAEYDREHGASR